MAVHVPNGQLVDRQNGRQRVDEMLEPMDHWKGELRDAKVVLVAIEVEDGAGVRANDGLSSKVTMSCLELRPTVDWKRQGPRDSSASN